MNQSLNSNITEHQDINSHNEYNLKSNNQDGKMQNSMAREYIVAAAPPPPPPAPPAKGLEEMLKDLIGSFGKYQFLCCFLMYISKFPVGWHQISIVILAAPMKFVCTDSGPPTAFDNVCVEGCSHYAFDTSVFHNTIVSDFELICDRGFLKSLNQLIFMFGIFVGSVVFGQWSDIGGRRLPMIVAVVLQFFAAFGASFCPEWYSFTFCRFMIGTATGATMIVSFVLVMEIVGTKYRDLLTILYQIPFTLGHIGLAGFGYFLKDWKKMQLAMALPSLLYFSYICFLTESPRWLIAKGKTDKAIKTLTKAAKCNGKPTEPVEPAVKAAVAMHSNTQKNEKPNMLTFFLDKRLQLRFIGSNLIWWSCGFGYFGLAQQITTVGANIFISIAMSGTLSLFGVLMAYPMNWKFGRKWTIIINNIGAAICCFIPAFSLCKYSTVNVVCGSIGMACLLNSFTTAYLYTGELFPTTLRNTAVGMGSASGRIGSMVAPFIAALNRKWLALIIFGFAPLISASVTFFLKETKWKPLPNSLDEL